MRFFYLLGLLLILHINSGAQQSSLDILTENFAFSIQTIDDFFDHFNFEPNTPAFKYIHSNYPNIKFDRKTVIFSLFDSKNILWKNDDINKFASEFEMEDAPKLHFEQSGWYAVLHCKVVYQKKRRRLDLIMEAESVVGKTGTVGYKWSLLSIKAPFIHNSDTIEQPDSVHHFVKENSGSFLHPMSHAINFMNIDDLFRKGLTRTYFAKRTSCSDLDTLVNLIDSSKIKFLQVDSVSYSLFQLPNWIIEVKYFNREEKNSGWLISRLYSASENEKKKYLMDHLNIR